MKQGASSMQLTRAADYAIRVMVHMATQEDGARMLLPQLAGATEVSRSFLSKVLQELVQGGFVASWRGQAGGFELLERGRRATVREIIEAIDGPVHLNTCLIAGRECSRKSWCPAHPVWVRAQRAMMDVLSSATIAELAEEARFNLENRCRMSDLPVQIELAS
jgi:Rrf2 family protein